MSTTEQHASIEHGDAVDLDARYGRTPARARRIRWIAVGAAAAFVVVLVAWVLWAGLGSNSDLEVVDTGHTVIDESLVEVRYQLTVEPGESASCAAQALNSTFGIVGWRIVDVPPSDARTRNLGIDVRTTELAVTGLIYRCWLT